MEGKIDATFGTFQRDMFESGLVAEVGPNAFAVWTAIKSHADFQTGKAWPSIRRLCDLVGLTDKTVMRCIETLEVAHLLRIDTRGTRRTATRYVARERLDIRLGNRLLCQIVLDYIPAQLANQLHRIKETLKTGERNPDAFSQVEIIPGPGFKWDQEAGVLRAEIPVRELPRIREEIAPEDFAGTLLGLRMTGVQEKAKRKRLTKE